MRTQDTLHQKPETLNIPIRKKKWRNRFLFMLPVTLIFIIAANAEPQLSLESHTLSLETLKNHALSLENHRGLKLSLDDRKQPLILFGDKANQTWDSISGNNISDSFDVIPGTIRRFYGNDMYIALENEDEVITWICLTPNPSMLWDQLFIRSEGELVICQKLSKE